MDLPKKGQCSKRKKKRSFMQQVNKRFRKSSSFSKGKQFDGTVHEYFIRVLNLERNFEGSEEEKAVFANNALAQTDGQEVECSFNQLISRVIESLLPLASNKTLERFYDAFGVNLRPICVHDYASHVLQTLMVAAVRQISETGTGDSNHIIHCKTWLLKVSKYLLNNIDEFMWEMYANPILRTAMYCLAGMPHLDKHDKVEKINQKEPIESSKSSIQIPPEFSVLLEEFFRRISAWAQFKDLVSDPLSSGYLQSLLRALKPINKKMYKSLCKKIMDECFPTDPSEDSTIMSSPTALPVLEVMIEQSTVKLQQNMYDQLLAGRLLEMSTTRLSNITVQKFVNKCSSPEMVAEIVKVLVPGFHKIIISNCEAVVVSLCQACERLNTSQSEFFKGLMRALNCDSSEEALEQLVPAVLSLTPPPYETVPSPSKNGSFLVQSLLGFQKPIKVVKSILMYDSKQLADLLSSPFGSHVTSAFCKSRFIGDKSRLKLIQHLQGHYPYLAQSKFGSRSFDDIWDVAELKSRELIVRDLATSYSEVVSSQYGKFVASKVRLDDFRNLGVIKWREKLQSVQSKKKLFAAIIGDTK